MQWKRLEVSGNVPKPRYGHSANVLGKKVIIFGGTKVGSQDSDELFILNTKKMKWKQCPAKGIAPVRTQHSACVIDKKLYIFGGIGNGCYCDEVHVFDTTKKIWSVTKFKGEMPSSRRGHTASVVKNKIYIFGGEKETNLFNDLYVLNTDDLSATRISSIESTPTARAWHTAPVINDHHIVICGGIQQQSNSDGQEIIYIFDTEKNTWATKKVQSSGDGDAKLSFFGHTTSVFGTRMVIVGGKSTVTMQTIPLDLVLILNTGFKLRQDDNNEAALQLKITALTLQVASLTQQLEEEREKNARAAELYRKELNEEFEKVIYMSKLLQNVAADKLVAFSQKFNRKYLTTKEGEKSTLEDWSLEEQKHLHTLGQELGQLTLKKSELAAKEQQLKERETKLLEQEKRLKQAEEMQQLNSTLLQKEAAELQQQKQLIDDEKKKLETLRLQIKTERNELEKQLKDQRLELDARLQVIAAKEQLLMSEQNKLRSEKETLEKLIEQQKKEMKHTNNIKLIDAILKNKMKKVKQCLDDGCNVKQRDEIGATPLHYAAKEGNMEVVKMLIYSQGYFPPFVSIKDREGYTAADWAIRAQQPQELIDLLKKMEREELETQKQKEGSLAKELYEQELCYREIIKKIKSRQFVGNPVEKKNILEVYHRYENLYWPILRYTELFHNVDFDFDAYRYDGTELGRLKKGLQMSQIT